MKTKLAVMFALLALVPFALAACGGDDDDDDAATEPTTTEETDTGDERGRGRIHRLVHREPRRRAGLRGGLGEATAGTVTSS